MSEPPAILTLPAAVLAFLWASETERPGPGSLPGLLFGLTAMFRPEYLFVGAAFVVLAAIRVGRPAAGSRGLAGAGLLVAGAAAADRALDDPQRRRARPRRCRSRPAAARRSTSAPSCPPTANTSGSRRSWSSATKAAASTPTRQRWTRSTRRRCSTASPRATPTCPRDSALGKIGKENFSDVLRRRPARLRGDDRAQGRADVEQRRRRSDEQHASGGRVQILLVAARTGRLRPARAAPPLVGAGRAGDADPARHRGRRRLAGGTAPQRGADDAGLSSCRPGACRGGSRPYPLAANGPQSRHLPRRTDGAARRRADLRDRPDRLRARPPPLAAQRRRADPARSPGSGWRWSPGPKSSTACSPPSPSKRATAAASSASPSSPSSSSSC